MRMFAKPPPHTMTREWQEAANDYLKVRHVRASRMCTFGMLTLNTKTGAKIRSLHRRLLTRVQGTGSGPVPTREGLRLSCSGWERISPLSVEEAEAKTTGTGTILSLPHGLTSMYKMMSRERESNGAAAWLDGGDFIRGCKYVYENPKILQQHQSRESTAAGRANLASPELRSTQLEPVLRHLDHTSKCLLVVNCITHLPCSPGLQGFAGAAAHGG